MPRHPVLERTCKTADRPLSPHVGTRLSEVKDTVPEENVMPMLDDTEGDPEVVELASEPGEQGEVEPLTVAPSPTMPSAAEVEEHRITHIPTGAGVGSASWDADSVRSAGGITNASTI